MLRSLLLAGAVIVAIPALAQTTVSTPVDGGVNTTGAHVEANLQAGPETNLDHNDAPGFTGTGGPYEPAAKAYPPCSRTVTDRCVQTREPRRRR